MVLNETMLTLKRKVIFNPRVRRGLQLFNYTSMLATVIQLLLEFKPTDVIANELTKRTR